MPTYFGLDEAGVKAFHKFYKSLGDKPKTTVRFFDRSEFYTVHGEDAEFAAKVVFKSTAALKKAEISPDVLLTYVTLSKMNFEEFARHLLIVLHHRVEVYTSKGGAKNQEWNLEYRGSPGNLLQFEDLLFSNREMVTSSSLISVFFKQSNNQKNLGVACLDNNRIFHIMEFVDDDFFSELEAIAVLLSPKECLLPSTDGDYAKIQMILERNGILVTRRKSSDFKLETNVWTDYMNKLLHFEKGQQQSVFALSESTLKLAMSALCAAIIYMDLVNDTSNHGTYRLEKINLNRFVHLDGAAVSALNLTPKVQAKSFTMKTNRWTSVLGVLDYCKTPQGHRLLLQWLKQPLRDLNAIKDRHDIVECFVNDPVSCQDIRESILKYIPDVMMLVTKLLRKKANLEDVYKLYVVATRIPSLLQILKDLSNSTINSILYEPLKDVKNDLSGFKQMVLQILDMDGIDEGRYNIKAEFDPELKSMKEKMEAIENKMRRLLSKAMDDLGLQDQIKLDFVSHIGYHFRITLSNEKNLRKQTQYQTIDVVKGGVRFKTTRLSELNSDYCELKEQYEEQQKSIVTEVVRIAAGYRVPFATLNSIIAQIDTFCSFAKAAVSAPIQYVRPKICSEGSGRLYLKRVRHPCIEMQEDVNFIPNDIDFQSNVTNMQIITGPNCGGKSTYIRSAGVAVLLALIGSFVPCDEAEIPIVDSIMARVGADDNIRGLSTFMVEMVETTGIIRSATEKSLVIIDELGRGTSTFEGCGIAFAIAEHLAKHVKCITLFATHFHEITELAQSVPTVKNFHMLAVTEDDSFTLLYQVAPGVVEKSFGIQVAKLADFPAQVVKDAQTLYEDIDERVNFTVTDADLKSALEEMRGQLSENEMAFVLKQL
ncbi:DNA mismatch repair protein spellchecker 1 [Culicoides brevitarsis]|uniref:DNA mismatch repair protein spellchecker 1 n=1 Tax=Culicoides brevitarsis TaxID=469753 RepID=UPI00307C977B